MSKHTHIRLKERIPGITDSIWIGPDGARSDCPAVEEMIRPLNLSSPEQIILHGVVSGDGMGTGNYAELQDPYFFVTFAEVRGRPTVHPEVIEMVVPEDSFFVVVPWIANKSFPSNDKDEITAFLQAERNIANRASTLLNLFTGTEQAGEGIDIYIWDESPEDCEVGS